MFVLGHVGLTAAAARSADKKVELAWAALLGLLPDLIDKPLYVLARHWVHGNTRSVGHSLTGALVVLALLLALRVRRPSLLWLCYLGHLVLDEAWSSPGRHDGAIAQTRSSAYSRSVSVLSSCTAKPRPPY